MKKKLISLTGIVTLTGVMSSCYYNPALYPSYTPAVTVSSAAVVPDASQAWVSATYDTAGIPIYGYSYGRPVYGYTTAGAAIFTLAAITALVCVPDWGYASWYRGTWRYPSHIRRYHAPPRYPKAHHPNVRPSHRPHSPSHHPGSKPSHKPSYKPSYKPSHKPAKYSSSHKSYQKNTTIINNNTTVVNRGNKNVKYKAPTTRPATRPSTSRSPKGSSSVKRSSHTRPSSGRGHSGKR